MMSCPLPLPLPILPSALHADFPPVHIGIKVCVSVVHAQPPTYASFHLTTLSKTAALSLYLSACSLGINTCRLLQVGVFILCICRC